MPEFDADQQDLDLPAFEPEAVGVPARPSAEHDAARLALAVKLLRQMHEGLGHVLALLEGGDVEGGAKRVADLMGAKREAERAAAERSGARVVEGVFDGIEMIGSDGRAYPVPSNYASKSRLVEGDVLKLTVRADGAFLFKQVGPVERRRLTGTVALDSSTGTPVVVCAAGTYKVLPASASFFQAEPGDEAVIFVPKSRSAVWAAVENIVKK